MGLETGSFPSDLVETNPTGTDLKSQGDDHIRLIKKVLKATLPNVNAAITPTAAQLNVLASENTYAFPGMIVMWSGVGVPAGWKLCDGVGTISNGNPVPDLRDRFIVGAGTSYAVGATGGSATHTHTATVNSHVLTVAQIPAHTHAESGYGNISLGNAGGPIDGGVAGGLITRAQLSVGGNEGHTHTATVTAGGTLPPYYALALIIKN